MRAREYKSNFSATAANENHLESLPYPTGWFCVGFSKEWRTGQVRAVPFMGSDIVVYRTRRGRLKVTRPYCPHLGAHLGAGGRIDGELLVCPFHGFSFDTDGSCVRTPYGTPPKVSLDLLPVREKHGIVWVWHSADGMSPTWQVPDFPETARPSAFRMTELAGHPQEVVENLVDYRHAVEIHGLQYVDVLEQPCGDGPFYSMKYRVGRGLLSFVIAQEIVLHFVGLGAALIVFDTLPLRMKAAQWLLATPTGPGRMRYWCAAHVVTGPGSRVPAPLRRGIERALGFGMNSWTMHDAQTDLPIWHHKAYLPHPGLNDADGPIGPFRHWARQFYPQEIPATS
ncbi:MULTISPECIES: aromatic ring-hydroxylating oxygenase subunit alpha [Streptomyces]|nr:Rieske 2Fe-2S domain-containing protein [Streptomyces luteoverticillatus]